MNNSKNNLTKIEIEKKIKTDIDIIYQNCDELIPFDIIKLFKGKTGKILGKFFI